ncbi:hypothetical protein INR49_002181 [Caranx melampygus]|nr:hypothetical protein INR49_002181 [Caranx melampygus]
MNGGERREGVTETEETDGMGVMATLRVADPQRGEGGTQCSAACESRESEVTTVNRCLDAAKACNIDETCQKLRTEYVSACIQPSARSGPCNRPKCNKALRKFFDRVPPDYTHELLFCPCTDTACAERRRQTIVPSCSYEDKDKPNCLAQLRLCNSDYVCRKTKGFICHGYRSGIILPPPSRWMVRLKAPAQPTNPVPVS